MALLLFPLILAFSSMTGCIEGESQPHHGPSAGGEDQQQGIWSGQLRMDIDPELRSDLFRLRGDAILAGNGTLPYLMLNATLSQGKASVVSTKYLLMKLEPNRDYSFEIAKNTKLLPGEYICTLEASGPGGTLSSESRRCCLEMDQADLISSKISSGELIPASIARALYAGRTLDEHESIERSHQMESLSREEDEGKVGAEKEGESEENGEQTTGMKASSPTSPEDLSHAPQPLEDKKEQEDLKGSDEASAKGEGSRPEDEDQSNDRASDSNDVDWDKNGVESGDPEPFDPDANPDHENSDQLDGGRSPFSGTEEDMKDSDEGAGMNAGSGEGGEIIAAAASLKMPPEEPGGEPEARFVGSSTSKKYHLPDCRYALKIKPENRVDFQSAKEAKSQGYLPCKSCHP